MTLAHSLRYLPVGVPFTQKEIKRKEALYNCQILNDYFAKAYIEESDKKN